MSTTNAGRMPTSSQSQKHDSWLDPDLPQEVFRQLGYRVVDMIAEYYDSLDELPVFPGRTSSQVAGFVDEPLPMESQDPHAILDEWKEKILPNTTHLGSPRYFGYVNGSGTMMATLAEALVASVNMNPGGWKAGPAATEIERRTIAWLAELVRYPISCGGLFTSGGTMANFTAVLTALRNTAPYDTTRDGLQTGERQGRFLLYMADHEGHVSVIRVADMLNLGRSAIRRVPSRDDFTMDPDALESLILKDKRDGNLPFCVVAQVGSINAGAVDPLPEIARICADQDLWFHADGANGAVGRMLPEKEYFYRGLEQADSLTLDPHKWLAIPYECGCVLVRDPEKLRRAFSLTAPYLRGTLPTEYSGLDYLEYGPQMSRGFRALKVWMTLKYYGVNGYRKLLAQGVRCAERLDELVRNSEDFEALHEPQLFIYSFRYAPVSYRAKAHRSDKDKQKVNSYLDWLNQRIADEIQASGFAFIMTSMLRGRTVLRLSICSHRTTLADIESVFEKLNEIGRAMQEKKIP